MSDAPKTSSTVALSNALVALHKEQFGRGPVSARTHFAGPDVVVTVFYDALLPAERALTAIGEHLRVQEGRIFFQEATRDRFIETIEGIMQRKVHSFHSTCDARTGIVMEIAHFEPRDPAASRLSRPGRSPRRGRRPSPRPGCGRCRPG